MTTRAARGVRHRFAAPLGLLLCVVLVASACIPQDSRNASEVGDAERRQSEPPEFPATGVVPTELLVEGLVWDLTTGSGGLDLWLPPTTQAECAAEAIVAAVGADRLSALGYRPGGEGTALNEVGLSATERAAASTAFQECVDMTQANAAILMGSGNMTSTQALCMAEGLDQRGRQAVFVDAWLAGGAVDPLAEGDGFADVVLSYAKVCLPEDAFTWFGDDSAGEDDDDGSGSRPAVPGPPADAEEPG